MKHRLCLCMVTVMLCLVQGFYAVGEDEPKEVLSRITEVTVYSDRARVTRKTTVDIKQGTTICAFTKLPGWIDEDSIRAALSPADICKISDVRMKREYLAHSNDETFRKVEAEVQEISDKITEIEDELQVLLERKTQIESIRAFSLQKLPNLIYS